jgi:hypothetical protein
VVKSIADMVRQATFVRHFGRKNLKSVVINNGVFTINGDCFLKSKVSRLPCKFELASNFDCSENRLTTLDGSPKTVLGRFICNENILRDLIGGPEKAYVYDCRGNPLTSLDGLANNIGGILYLTITDSLPILKLLSKTTLGKVLREPMYLGGAARFANSDTRLSIINKYLNLIEAGTTKKQAMWQCQQELINLGFDKNATW